MRKKLKFSSDGGDSGNNKCKRNYDGAYGGVWRSVRLAGFWGLESDGRFCVGAFGRNLASVAVKMFSRSIHFIKKFYECRTFNAICKDNAAINCINTSTQKRLIFVNFDESYANHYIWAYSGGNFNT
jgi:hypothetical protein